MFIRLKLPAALISSAAFIYSASSYAQAPIVDASIESTAIGAAATTQVAPALSNSAASELFIQLQQLQQEVMQLRGIVEEQAYLLRQVKEQNMERYIDLDRRLGSLASNPAATTPRANSAVLPAAVTVVALAGEKSVYDAAYALVINKRFTDALEAFKQFLVDFPDGKYAPNSYYWMGELYQVVVPQDLDASREAFSQLLAQYPGHAKAADAMYKLGKVHFLKGNKTKSRDLLEQVIASYSKGPNASAADKARQFINANF